MQVLSRNNVQVIGRGSRPMVLAHGFGCDQTMWRAMAPAFEADWRLVLFDHVGAGRSDISAYDPARYGHLRAYADDVLDICRALDLGPAVLVGHSVSAMIGMLAAIAEPRRFSHLVMVCPSPRYVDDGDYVGGFQRHDVEDLLATLDRNYLGWSRDMAPVIMGNPDRPELGEELANSFCRTSPAIARQFARLTFLGDNRDALPRLATPTLILQCAEDMIAPAVVGDYVHRHIAGSRLVRLAATGHCPHLSAPAETAAAIRAYLDAP